MEHNKVKSAAKLVTVRGERLDQVRRRTMRTISDIVGATLGPHGQPVLIERAEYGLPPFITKDGVTVFRSLGFEDATAHCLMESARDTAVRTASEAGDGTTTATILFEAIASRIDDYCKAHPRVSPQRVTREMEAIFRDFIEPQVRGWSRKVGLESEEDRKLLHSVATVSANGDAALADAVMECFDVTGDEGNVTIVEQSGPSRYQVEQIKGFSIGMGYDESCGKFFPQFINDPGTQRVVMEKPLFILYHGQLTEMQTIGQITDKVGVAWQDGEVRGRHNVVICATGFSDQVLAYLGATFPIAGCINVFPLLVPLSPQSNGQLEFLQDVSAITGATIYDPLSAPLENATLEGLGGYATDGQGPGVEAFECSRFRSSIIGYADPSLVEARVEELDQQLGSPESELDAILLRERKAKITGGIAKLRVIGSSNGELKEKRDRAEDAVCAVRGAIRHGCLPGGAWTLIKLVAELPGGDVCNQILVKALMAPFERLMSNSGIVEKAEFESILAKYGVQPGDPPIVYDFLNQKHVDAFEGGILDSTPAVLEALRNAISIASVQGTLGGCVVSARDHQLERQEAVSAAAWQRDANVNEADQRP